MTIIKHIFNFRPVADVLSIPRNRIYANELIYDTHGEYLGFDENEPTSDSGSKTVGKAGVCGMLKKNHGYKNLVMVSTELYRDAIDLFLIDRRWSH